MTLIHSLKEVGQLKNWQKVYSLAWTRNKLLYLDNAGESYYILFHFYIFLLIIIVRLRNTGLDL